MNTTTNTRGVSEAMVERFKAAFAEHSTISPAYDGCIRAGIEAALSAEPAAQGEDRQEAFVCSNPQCGVVHAVDPCGFCPACVQESGAGWSTSRRRYYGRAQKMRPSAERRVVSKQDHQFA